MAEGSSGNKEEGGWWGYGWLQTAKEKSKAALEMVQKDLAEYTCTMSADTSKAVAHTSDKLKDTLKTENTSAAKDRLKSGVTSFLEGLSKALVIEPEGREEPVKKPVSSEAVYDRAKARLHAIQVDPETYCSEPTGSPERFQEWQKSFDLEKHKGDVSELLVSKVELRAFYTKLVPAEISHADFWKRYFYKVHQLQQDEARKLALMKRAERAQKKEDSISWEDDWSGDEESITEKTDRKQELSERLSQPKEVQKDTMPSEEIKSESVTVGADKPTAEESRVNPPEQDTDKEQTPSETIHPHTVDSTETRQGKEEQSNSEKITQPEITTDSPKQIVIESESSDIVSQPEEKESKTELLTPDVSEEEVKTKDKGDMVVVNPDRVTPSSDSNKENSTDDDWERDFDVELTEEELKAADEIAKKLNLSAADYTSISGDIEEDWESWE